MAKLQTERVSLETLGILIKPLTDSLSIGRAKMMIEQIRQTVASGGQERLIMMTTSIRGSSDPLAAVVALVQPGLEPNTSTDVATILHAGSLRKLEDQGAKRVVVETLSDGLDCELRSGGVGFVQWATEPTKIDASSDHLTSHWCSAFGFQAIGTLDYLCGPVSADSDHPFGGKPAKPLNFRKVSWSEPSSLRRMTDLIEATYRETLDCPQLSQFRTTEQVLVGYRTSEAFRPDLWFIASDSSGNDVGCAIFAAHGFSKDSSNDENGPDNGSVEIVYMGLTENARGNQYGQRLVQKSFDVAHELGASQVLLAVDRNNTPAKSIYQSAGLKPIIKETVWVKLIETNDPNRA